MTDTNDNIDRTSDATDEELDAMAFGEFIDGPATIAMNPDQSIVDELDNLDII